MKAIGISNFYPDRVMDFIHNQKIVPVVNQIETHPFCQQIETQKFLSENGIQIESWAPFAEGLNNLFSNTILTDIAENHKKSVAQIVLRWLIQRNIVVIPKSIHKGRIIENISVFDFELSNDEMNKISKLDTNKSVFLDHRDPETVKWFNQIKFDI